MTKISNLPADSAPTSDDYIVVNDSTSGQTKKVLLSDLLTFTTNGVSELLGSTVTASVAGVNSTTYVDFTNGSVTFTMPTTARKVLILVSFSINGSAANLLEWAVREGASVLLTGREPMNGTGGWTSTVSGQIIVTPTAGSHTYKISANRATGSGTIDGNGYLTILLV